MCTRFASEAAHRIHALCMLQSSKQNKKEELKADIIKLHNNVRKNKLN